MGSVRDNVIRGGAAGLVTAGATRVSGNDVQAASAGGITVGSGSPVLRDNRSCGNGENLVVYDRADPDIDESNEICEDSAAE